MKFTVYLASLMIALTGSPLLSKEPVIVNESFFTQRDEGNNVDSLATWHGPNDEHWLIVTAKGTHCLLIYNAFNGSFVKQVGQQGSKLGQFNRPNGISVVGDKAFVVERDNQRVQVLSLPDFFQLGSFGMDHLINPYGLYVWEKAWDHMTVYVTDNYETPAEEKPPLSELGSRVHVYEVTFTEVDSLEYSWTKAFGDTSGEGVLNIVESIYGDPAYNHLMIGDEEISAEGQAIKRYTADGKFTGYVIGRGIFKNQPEGIALWETSERSGYWIFTDQGMDLNQYLVFDRESLEYRGAITGTVTSNTDGIWLDPTSSSRFTRGALYAIHNDGNATAFSLAEIAAALGLD